MTSLSIEVQSSQVALGFAARLADGGFDVELDDATVISVRLPPRVRALGELLNLVEELLSDEASGHAVIRLDGRNYLFESRTPV